MLSTWTIKAANCDQRNGAQISICAAAILSRACRSWVNRCRSVGAENRSMSAVPRKRRKVRPQRGRCLRRCSYVGRLTSCSTFSQQPKGSVVAKSFVLLSASVLRFIPGGFEGSHIGHPLHALLCKAMGVFSEVFRRRLCRGHVSFDIVFYLVVWWI